MGIVACWCAGAWAPVFAYEDAPASVGRRAAAPQKSVATQPNRAQNRTQTQNYRRRPARNLAMRPVADSKAFNQAGEYIFLYYDNFSVNKTLGGMVRCNVRFIVMTTLQKKLNTLSVKLKWPDMQTALNFSDVEPNVENYFEYTLVGSGCYSMDKIPNIIVNRCRVSQMTQEQCAAKILWLKKR